MYIGRIGFLSAEEGNLARANTLAREETPWPLAGQNLTKVSAPPRMSLTMRVR